MGDIDMLMNAPVVGGKKTFPRTFGRYVLEKSLSRGGMGEVFLAFARGVHKRCVIKTIRGDLTGDDEFIGRFADEAKIMVRIAHPNIIRVFDAGKVDNDYYIAMEYVHGRDLGDVLDRAYERGEPMPLQLGLYISSKLLRGLDHVHKLTDEHGRHMGLVHRDVSPQNVLVGFDGAIKLIDFGLARTELLPGRTQGALAVGKYGYMSPEQARHEEIDGRADIYSFGVMLFEVFTGDRLVDEQDQATLWQRVLNPKHRRPKAVLPSMPHEFDDLVMRAVAVSTEERFADAVDMLRAVEALRGEGSNREAFTRYLRHLYPRVDFAPPPLTDFDDADVEEGCEKSIVFALSREGALSVFGRGRLAIEWAENQERSRRPGDSFFHHGTDEAVSVVTDARVIDAARAIAKTAEPTPMIMPSKAREPRATGDSDIDGPTRIRVRHPDSESGRDDSDRENVASQNDRTHDDPRQRESVERSSDGETIETQSPIHEIVSGPRTLGDDEMTVMMEAPPRSRQLSPILVESVEATTHEVGAEPPDERPIQRHEIARRDPKAEPDAMSAKQRRSAADGDAAHDTLRTPLPPEAASLHDPMASESTRGVWDRYAPRHGERSTARMASTLDETHPEGRAEPSSYIPGLILLGTAVAVAVLSWFLMR